MAIPAGTRLGSYEILQSIGAGGMGEVYKATDTRLGRMVAIKVLPAQFSGLEEFKQRFEREAQLIAGLNHPHVCTLYDVGKQGGMDFLVMEFLEGETMAARLARGPLPLDEALRYAIQISDALDKAHTVSITHRDLKPANVMLTKSGAKLMDFGLAKRRAPNGRSSASMATGVTDLTQRGSILGTVQYMAPEQIEGEEADARTDIFAFGAVLYEMVTGKKAFSGKSQATLMASILQQNPPPMSTLQPVAPPVLQRLVEICLAKGPRDRWQTVHDVMLQLKGIAEGGSVVGLPTPAAHRRKTREYAAWTIATVSVVAVCTLAVLYFWRTPEDIRAVQFWIPPNNGTVFGPENAPIRPFPAISPDGKRIVFVAGQPGETPMLWIRSLDSLDAQPLAGTEEAQHPFWSPDSRYIGFFADRELKKVEATGGPVQVICEAPGQTEGTWNQDGVILFVTAGGISSVSDAGGEPVAVTTPNKELKETIHRAPYFLPDGRHFLYLAQTPNVIYAGSIDSTEPPKLLLPADSRAVYAPQGYLLFVRGGTLMGQRFDPKRLKLSGDPFPIAENLRFNAINGRAAFAVSNNGTLVYRTGEAVASQGLRVVWFDRSGTLTDSISNQTDDNRLPKLSPDEKRIVVQRRPSLGCTNCIDLWILDLVRGANTRLTYGLGDEFLGAWAPDGSRISYRSNSNGLFALYTKLTTGIANEELLLKLDDQDVVGTNDWSSDTFGNQFILLTLTDPATGSDIWVLPLGGEPRVFVKTPFNEGSARLSPNGKLVAFVSNESGSPQIYVQPFPSGGPRVQISVDSGTEPRWRQDGKELLFMGPQLWLIAVDMKATSTTVDPGTPKPLFQLPVGTGTGFAVTADGQRFLFAVPPNSATATDTPADNAPMTVILNWTETLKQ